MRRAIRTFYPTIDGAVSLSTLITVASDAGFLLSDVAVDSAGTDTDAFMLTVDAGLADSKGFVGEGHDWQEES